MKKRLISVLLVIVMLVPLFCVNTEASGNYKTITCLGDSASSGYGLEDYYSKNQLVLFNERIKGSYPDLVASSLNANTLHPYGLSGIRTSELRMLLDYDYDGDRILKDGVLGIMSDGFITYDKMTELRPKYIDAVSNSDLVILDIGFDDIWIPTISTIYQIAEHNYFDPSSSEMTVREAVLKYGTKQAVLRTINNYLIGFAANPQLWVYFWTCWADAVFKWETDFMTNYDAIVERIYELNPDCTVLALGSYNPCNDWSIIPGDNTIENTIQIYYDLINSYKTKYEAVYDSYHYVRVRDIDLITNETTLPLYENLTLDDSGFNPHPSAEGHKQIASIIIDALNDINNESNSVVTSNSTSTGFNDVPDDAWYAKYVKKAVSQGIMSGTSETTFEPLKNITRGEVVTTLYAMEGKPSVNGNSGFNDVNESEYYANAVTWASTNGIIAGYEDGSFKPSNSVTREDLALMLKAYASYKGKNTSNTSDLSKFNDSSEVDSYALDAVSWAVSKEVLSGDDSNNLNPLGKTTRAEASAMLTSFKSKVLSSLF